MRRIWLLSFLSVTVVTLCFSCHDISGNREITPKSIYFDYRVWGDEDAGYMTVRLQYKLGGPGGTTIVLSSPAKVELDGTIIKVDSTKMNGAYYEVTKPVREFTGSHTIVLTDKDGKQHKEEFSFQPIRFKNNFPTEFRRADLPIDLEGLSEQDYVRLMLSDTVRFSKGIDRIDTVHNGHIVITRDALEKVASGPVHLELAKESERRIRDGISNIGLLSISYELRRGFELKD